MFQTVRIEIEEMDAVLRAVTETGVYLAALKREVARLRELRQLVDGAHEPCHAGRARAPNAMRPR